MLAFLACLVYTVVANRVINDYTGQDQHWAGVGKILPINFDKGDHVIHYGQTGTGSSVVIPGVDGQFVLTAAHVFVTTHDDIEWGFGVPSYNTIIYFGMTGEDRWHGPDHRQTITPTENWCIISQVVVPPEWLTAGEDDHDKHRYDYAIGKLHGPHCKPPHSFPLSLFDPSAKPWANAGFGGTFDLTIFPRTDVTLISHDVLAMAGTGRNGDSGGPLVETKSKKVIGVMSNIPIGHGKPEAVGLTTHVMSNLKKMAAGTWGHVKTQSAHRSRYEDELEYGYYGEDYDNDEFSIYEQAAVNLQKAQEEFRIAQQLMNWERHENRNSRLLHRRYRFN